MATTGAVNLNISLPALSVDVGPLPAADEFHSGQIVTIDMYHYRQQLYEVENVFRISRLKGEKILLPWTDLFCKPLAHASVLLLRFFPLDPLLDARPAFLYHHSETIPWSEEQENRLMQESSYQIGDTCYTRDPLHTHPLLAEGYFHGSHEMSRMLVWHYEAVSVQKVQLVASVMFDMKERKYTVWRGRAVSPFAITVE